MRCTCQACGEVFNAESTFGRHRVGDYTMAPDYGRRCLTRQEMRAKGWSLNDSGAWITASWDKNYRIAFRKPVGAVAAPITGDQASG